ncbi:MAG: serine/threonine protein kinase [Rhodospirillales bacterium]|nr:MAG: serine/threonine protein kinase [Rhodospirillales bacterium]
MTQQKLATGVDIDGFRLEERIYSGNMSSLWRCQRADIDIPIVIKIPKLGYGADPTAIIGFEVEQMILPTLKGRNVPRFVAAGDFTSKAYLVTEFITGEPLAAQMLGKPLPIDRIQSIGAKVATAIYSLHAQNVIHLDVKPQNILFRESGEAVLIDFGLAHHNQLPDLLSEEMSTPLGSGGYISPEQVVGVRTDHRSDIFSLGVLLYTMVTGKEPFGMPQSISGLRQRLYKDPAPPRALNPECPPWLQEIILRCLAVDPNDRYNSAAEVGFQLQNPDQVLISAAGEKLASDGLLQVAKRWFRSVGIGGETLSIHDHLNKAPFIAVAIEVSQSDSLLAVAQRTEAQRLFESAEGARLACITVMRTARLGMDMNVDKDGNNLHVKALVQLKHWARELRVPEGRLTFHVLEHPSPAEAIIKFAWTNHVDHLIVGAQVSPDTPRIIDGALIGSDSRKKIGIICADIVAMAPCSVTVVRARKAHDD